MTNFIVTTKRTRIRKITLEDAPFLLELLNTQGWVTYIGDRNLKTISDVESYIEKFFINVYQECGFGYYHISSLDGDDIGIAGFLKKPYLENEDYGFAILPKFYQMGFGYEIGEVLIEYGIKEFGFNKLDAVTMQSNLASQKLLEKLGFTKTGLITLPEKTVEDLLYQLVIEMKDNLFKFIKAPNAPVSDNEILEDLRRVAKKQKTNKVSQRLYGEKGDFDVSTVSRKFGTWNKAIEAAGLHASNTLNVPDDQLYKNILNLWEHFGRQPRRADLSNEISEYSQSPYNRRFSTWTNSLQNFVVWANGEELTAPEANEVNSVRRKTGRDPSLRLRFKVMQRDNFTCKQCGASPAKDPSEELHIDHIVPWSKGGDTTFENLQTLCLPCNLGKGNL